MAERDTVTSGLLVKTPRGDAAQNPLISISRKAAAEWFATLASSA